MSPPLLLVLPSPGPVPSLPAGAEEAVELLCILMSREQGQREVF